MVVLMARACIVLLALITHGAIATTLNGEKLVRQEPKRVQLTPSGAMTQAGQKSSPEEDLKLRNDHFCDKDFPVGLEGTEDCSNVPDSDHIKTTSYEAQNMCKFA